MSATRRAALAAGGTEWGAEAKTLCRSLARVSALAGKVSLENPELQACKEDDTSWMTRCTLRPVPSLFTGVK